MTDELEFFGEALTRLVRDRAITTWKSILSGHMKGRRAERVRKTVSSFDKQQLEVLGQLIPEVIDSTLFNMMVMIEEESHVHVEVELRKGHRANIRHLSDGLAGETVTNEGWFARFSKHPYTDI